MYKNGKRKAYTIAKLVATAFISNPENKPKVKHIDGNRMNNRVENLEWVEHKEIYHLADKMFEELGYEKCENDTEVYYEYENEGVVYEITFCKQEKIFSKRVYGSHSPVTMQELKAINKKCEELGWL